MGGASRQYTATFAIGARLLGSFGGAMAAAKARLRGLAQTSQRMVAGIGGTLKKLSFLFTGIFAGLAAFGAAKLFSKVFADANAEIEESYDTTRKLTFALMKNQNISKKGMDYAVKQRDLIFAQNAVMAKQGLLSQDSRDKMAAQVALSKLAPSEIVKSLGPMADVLTAVKGMNATEEDAVNFAKAWGSALVGGPVKALKQFGITVTPKMAKAFKTMKLDQVNAELLKLAKFAKGADVAALADPGGQTKKLNEDLAEMAERIGDQVMPARDAMSKAWRDLLPEVEPYLKAFKQMGVDAQMGIAQWMKSTLMPALKKFSAWLKSPAFLGAWAKIKKSWSDMTGKIGKALGDQFSRIAGKGRNLGDVVVTAMEKLSDALKWVGDNAKWLVPLVEGLTIALGALAAVAWIQGNITILGVAAAVAGIATVMSKYEEYKALLNGEAVSDPDHFTKHWYLLNQTWTEVFAGLEGAWETMKQTWQGVIDFLKTAWDTFVEKISFFKPPKWLTDWLSQHVSMDVSGRAAENAKDAQIQAAIDATRQARDRKQWLDAGGKGTPQEQATWIDQAKAGGAGRIARLPSSDMRPPKFKLDLPNIAKPMHEQAILPIKGIEKNVMSLQERWNFTFGDMVEATGKVNPALEETGKQIGLSLLKPIQDVQLAWSVLASSMGTPLSIPAAAAAAATGPAGLPAPDLPPEGVPGLASGGIVNRPTLAMIGERGPEAVVPLRGGGATSVNFAPVITINGNASQAEQAAMDTKLRDLARDFVAQFKSAQKHERRLSYEGGYG